MKKEEGFYFIPKKWLGDANVLAMDWDSKGMHLHLMAIAWQQAEKGFLIDDDKLIRKLLGNPELKDWEERIKPQIFSAWKQKMLIIDGVERLYWYQPGILKTSQEAEKENISIVKKPRAKKSKIPEVIIENPDFDGFSLKNLLKAKLTTTILYEKSDEEDKHTIWTLGTSLVKKASGSEGAARGFIAKLIKEYGEKQVSDAIAQLSRKAVPPAETHSYLVGILRKQQEEVDTQKRGTGKGRVSI